MFTLFVLALSLASSVTATPLYARHSSQQAAREDKSPVSQGVSPISFNKWRGFEALERFDDFNGIDNFDGSNNEQVLVFQEQSVVCQTIQVEVIQQQLVILQEFAKQVITQQICEVEVQTIILQQFSSGLSAFSSDITRQSSRQVGFDKSISQMISQLVNVDGSINASNFGFSGQDVGKNLVVPGGSNWNDNGNSRVNVQAALEQTKTAISVSVSN